MIVYSSSIFSIEFISCVKIYFIIAVYKSTQSIKWCQSESVYSAPGIAEYFLSSEWSKFVNSCENKFRCAVKQRIVSKVLSQ